MREVREFGSQQERRLREDEGDSKTKTTGTNALSVPTQPPVPPLQREATVFTAASYKGSSSPKASVAWKMHSGEVNPALWVNLGSPYEANGLLIDSFRPGLA